MVVNNPAAMPNYFRGLKVPLHRSFFHHSLKGWMVVVWGFLFLPIGFAIQTIALLKPKALPRWQSALFLIGVLLVGFPDGAEIINLTASMLMAVALVPYGMRMIANTIANSSL
jgi:hypothetical protein